mmetsp:Transcript_42605/g.68651  ORF Transcript_42605/g.68651 Transcript_42605/m.68651 type:complete len:96 (-) Transcript_42605:166-453(-)
MSSPRRNGVGRLYQAFNIIRLFFNNDGSPLLDFGFNVSSLDRSSGLGGMHFEETVETKHEMMMMLVRGRKKKVDGEQCVTICRPLLVFPQCSPPR